MLYITAVHMVTGGTRHEHIEKVRWFDSGNNTTNEATVPQMVQYIEQGNPVQVQGPPAASVGVNHTANGYKYIQTHADGTWTNNLLSLPRY